MHSRIGASRSGSLRLSKRNLKPLLASVLAVPMLTASANAAVQYWDINGATAGAGAAAATGTWNVANTNWSTDSAGGVATAAWTTGNTADFAAGTDATGNYIVTLGAAQTAAGVTLEEGNVSLASSTLVLSAGATIDVVTGKTLTITSVVGGSTFTKQNSGTLTLTGNNTFSGGITLSGGTLSMNGESSATVGAASTTGAIPASPVANYITLSNGADLQSTRTGAGVTFLATNKGIVLTGGGGSLDVTDPTAGNLNIYSGVVSGTGSLTKLGVGVLSITAAQTYVGATIVNNGTLRVRTNSNVFPSTSALTVTSPGIFDLNGLNQTMGSLAGTGNVNLGSGTLTIGGDNSSTTFSGNIVQTAGGTGGSVVKNGTGTMTVQGNDWSNTGGVTINGGTIKFGNSAAGFNSASLITIGASGTFDMNNVTDSFGALSGSGPIANQNSFTMASATLNSTYSGAITGTGSITKTGASNQTLTGTNNFTGNVNVIGSGTLTISKDAALGAVPGSVVANKITLNGGTLGVNTSAEINANRGITLGASNGIIDVTSGQTATYNGVITGAGGLTKSSSGTLNLGGANNFAGDFSITGGSVNFNNDSAVSSGKININPLSAITLRNAGTNLTTTLANNIVVASGAIQTIDMLATAGNSLILNGQIGSQGFLGITRGNGGGAGTVAINGNNTAWLGTMTLKQGTLQLGNKNALGTATLLVTPGAATPILSASPGLTGANAIPNRVSLGGTFTVGGSNDLELAGTVNLSDATRSLAITNTGVTTISGPITGASATVGISKDGPGTLVLSGNSNTYQGGTTVNSGVLLVNNTANLGTGTGTNTLAGGTLGGTGTISAVIANGGVLMPGNNGTPGVLTVASATLNNLATTTMNIGGPARGNTINDFSALVSQDGIQYGGALKLNLVNSYSPAAGATFDVLDWIGSKTGGFNSFDFSGAPLAAGLHWDTSNVDSTGEVSVAQDTTVAQLLTGGSAQPDRGTVHMVGSGGNYELSSISMLPPNASGNITIDDLTEQPVIVLLDIDDNSQVSNLVTELQSVAGGYGYTLSSDKSNGVLAAYQGDADYDIALTFANNPTSGMFQFEYDFSHSSGIGGTVNVANIGVVPEPSSLFAGAAALAAFVRRRRRTI